MSDKFRVAIFTTIDSPLLSTLLENLIINTLADIVVICDSKRISEKNRIIWSQRTGGLFKKVDLIDSNIYKISKASIPFYFVNNHNDEETLNLINFLSVDVILNGGTPRKLKKHILDGTRYGAVNIHPGILPYYRGCTAVEWAIYNNHKVGNTAHFMTEDYDEGNIIYSEWYKFKTNSDYKSIRIKVYQKGIILAAKTLRLIFEKKFTSIDAIPQNNKFAKYWDPIPEDKLIKVFDLIKNGKYKYQNLKSFKSR